MKKIISVFLLAVLLSSISSFAFAEEDLLNYRWIDVEKIVNDSFGSDGTIWPINEVNATIWLPNIFSPIDHSGEGLEDCIDLFVTEDGANYVLVNYTSSDSMDLESFYTQLLQQGANVYKILVNDIPALEQDNDGSYMITFQTQEGKFLEFLFGPSSNPVYGLVMSSIISTVEEEPVPIEPESVEVPATPTPENPVSRLISK